MSTSESLYVVGCAAEGMQPDGTCTVPVWMPYPQPVLPPLDIADGFVVSVAVLSVWVVGVKARLLFRAARAGNY